MAEPTDSAIGIDIGGTQVRAALVSGDGVLIEHVESPLPPDGDPVLLGPLLREQMQRVLGSRVAAPAAVGVAVPGIWDRQTGIMQRALNLPKLEGINVVQLLEQALERPVWVEIDVNAAAWAQWHALQPTPARFIYLSLGTGVGGGVILDGQLVRHTHGGPGHFGHLIVDTSADAPQCRCGARGCLEALVSGPALARGRRQNPERQRRAHEHGPAAQHDIHTAGRALGIGLLQLAVIYAPDVIAVGGGVIDHEPGLLARACGLFRQLAGTLVPAGLRIETARLSTDRAGVIGAALLALA